MVTIDGSYPNVNTLMPQELPQSDDNRPEPPVMNWNEGLPYSSLYGDVYFSRDNGLAETQHVFLHHNRLNERWRSLHNSHFTIAETGFGTGLNFLCSWRLWKQCAPDKARLHFVSCEKHPLSQADLKSALALWPELSSMSNALLAQYYGISAGMHRLEFENGRVVLTLLIGDAAEMLEQLHANVDAWFLDGFAPARNPDMWQAKLFQQMARLSHNRTSFATFTSAGLVKRGLQDAGFKVEKVPGFGRKREMLCGSFENGTALAYRTPSKALVIGAGIAGCSSSYTLAKRGWEVTVIDRHDQIAGEASGNPAGMLYPRLAIQDTVMSRLALGSFVHTVRLLKQLNLSEADFSLCGLLQLAYDQREAKRCQAIAHRNIPKDVLEWVDAGTASHIAGIVLNHSALFFPNAGWVKPSSFCETLIQSNSIRKITNHEVLRIEYHKGLWQAWDRERLLDEAPLMVLAAANDCLNFEQAAHLPLQPVRGQISVVDASSYSKNLKTVLCSDGYISPSIGDRHYVGATFSPDDRSIDIRSSDHQENLNMLHGISPELQASIVSNISSGRAALRAATTDHLPLVGALMDANTLMSNPPKHYTKDPMPWLPGLYIHTGHGSKGISQAPFCAEILASAIHDEPLPIDAKTVAALDPNRFLLRKLGLKNLVKGLTSHSEISKACMS